ncbi:MAG: hypothetical protein HXO67_07580, partial [Rothia sp.]|nr:hypothetical protein [Rothia sp. (in: high G+C Gram-positive bacteria)]
MKNLGHGIHRTEQVVSLLGAGRALRASLRRSVRGSSQQVRRRRHRNQRRLSAHIPRLHPLFTYAAQAVRTGLSLLEPMFLASSELLGYRSFTHRGRNIYYRVDNLYLLTDSESAPGVLFYFDGDHLSRAGSRLLRRTSPLRAELAQVAAEFNMLSVPVLSPG